LSTFALFCGVSVHSNPPYRKRSTEAEKEAHISLQVLCHTRLDDGAVYNDSSLQTIY
jgi:hypothetical protein